MCYRTKLNTRLIEIEKSFDAVFSEPEKYEPRAEINGFDFSPHPIIADMAHGEILFYHWGLIPFWAKNDQIKKSTLNAKIESLHEKPAFRNAVDNRCLILADGYYEWQWLDPKGRQKQKYLIRVEGEPVFAFAGIYSSWTSPAGEERKSFSILTTEANELMSEIHNQKKRMPVIIGKKDHKLWLEGKSTESFAFPYEVPLKAEKV